MTDKVSRELEETLARLRKMQGKQEAEFIDDFIFTKQEENDWFEAEPDYAKRIATPVNTKQRRRVTHP